jgi:predicted DCC family thiol-disulfide oxidoreductase YuxK
MPFENPQATIQDTSSGPAILFFDGVCHLCNGIVDWVIQSETKHTLCFAPLQGTTAQSKLSEPDRKSLETLIVLTETGEVLKKSEAVIFILSRLPGGARFCARLLKMIPRFLRDFGYDLIAKNRYRWFGKRQSCRLPTPEEKGLLLP